LEGLLGGPEVLAGQVTQADREEQLADIQEATEQRMHSVADVLPPGLIGG
jgi:hypothetical protein